MSSRRGFRLTDQAVLVNIAKIHIDIHVRKAAVRMLTDKALLAEIGGRESCDPRMPFQPALDVYRKLIYYIVN
jgi:hypothetical protein